jgi:hypothetical protein
MQSTLIYAWCEKLKFSKYLLSILSSSFALLLLPPPPLNLQQTQPHTPRRQSFPSHSYSLPHCVKANKYFDLLK